MTRMYLLAAIIVLVMTASGLRGADPQVAFRIDDGFVRFAVTRDDTGMANVLVRVVDGPGAPFAEGEADDNGVGIFPAPTSPDCVVTFTIAGKDADPILLQFADRKTRVTPERVLITFDRRPCCQLSKLRPENASAGTVPWLLWTEIAIGIACLTGGFWLYLSRPGAEG